MGTGIVSVGMASANYHLLSLVLLVIAAAAWLALGLLLAWRTRRDPARVVREASTPAALTAVAATAVLGARATGVGWSGAAGVLLVIATSIWVVLLWPVVRDLPRRAAGVAFMVTVSTQSLSVLAAQVALRDRASWLIYAALVLLALGLAAYVVVLVRFDFGQLLEGRGDQWVVGGALAISTLAAARIVLAIRGLHQLGSGGDLLRVTALVLWGLSVAWLPVLLGTEAIRPRLRYDLRRWATVFPVGMYAACSFDAGRAANAPGLAGFARVWVWLGFGLWLVVFAATLRRGLSPRPPSPRTCRAAPSS